MKVSEHFYSIQGEGPTVGVPAYFIRLGKCNLICGGPGGCLMKQGKASWWCDSEAIWRKSVNITPKELIDSWEDQGLLKDILDGTIHIVWTGGEPTLEQNANDIMAFIDYIDEYYDNDIYCEIETNGTIKPLYGLFEDYIDQINCSPKLANSGMPEDKRIVPDAIENIMKQKNYNFKFVVSNEEDIKEIESSYVFRFNIPRKNITIMPGVDNRVDLPERTLFTFEMTKKYRYRGVTRQHILAWDKTTGV